eukprot:1975430-Rhodomonas_salina.3
MMYQHVLVLAQLSSRLLTLPPSSRHKGVRDLAHDSWTLRPTSTDPTKISLSTDPSVSTLPASPNPVTICTRSIGAPAPSW